MKRKTFVTILAAALCCFAFLPAGCGKGGGETGTTGPKNVALLGGFESVAELKTFLYSGTFHKAELNSDAAYITEGSRSAKFTLRGGQNGEVPKFDLFLDTAYAGRKVDFTDVQALTADVFNPSDETREMTLSLTTRKTGAVRASYVEKRYRLQKGYNRVVYTIDRSVASDICYMDRAEYVTMTFENSYAAPYVLYLDNLVAHTTDEAVVSSPKTYEEGELLFFDAYSDRFMVRPDTVLAQPSEAPTLSVCRDPRYIKQGTGSLQVSLVVTPSREGLDDAPGFKIKGEAIDRVDFTAYKRLEFSVIADGDIGGNNLSVIFYDKAGNGSGVCANLRASNDLSWGDFIPAKTWYTVSVDLTDLSDPQGPNRHPIDVENVDSISIFYGNLQTGEPYSMYFDEFKLIP